MSRRRKPLKHKSTSNNTAKISKKNTRITQSPVKKSAKARKTKLLLRFLVVGVLNTLVGYGLYAGFILLGIPYLIALLLSTILGVIFNYFSTGRLVFKSTGGLPIFIRFITAYIIVYFINATELNALIKHFLIDPYTGQAICVPTSVILSWILMNYWVFRRDKHEKSQKIN